MKKNDCIIRLETKADHHENENLIRESFWNVYRPGCYEHYLIRQLRNDPAFVQELNFVMEKDGRLIGQNVFVRGEICADDGRSIPVLAMGPICIANDLKRQGYGKMLLDYTLEKAAEMGFGAVCLEGNVDFYGKSGFVPGTEKSLRYRGFPDAPFFLCRELIPGYLDGVSGEYGSPEAYEVDEKEVDGFDQAFPPKQKLKLPGQLV